jgi:hypothetical protein
MKEALKAVGICLFPKFCSKPPETLPLLRYMADKGFFILVLCANPQEQLDDM